MTLRRLMGIFAALTFAMIVAAAPAAAGPTYPPKPPGEKCVVGVESPGCPVARNVQNTNDLPETGSNSLVPMVATGFVLILLGGGLLVVRRRQSETRATQ